jgi:hemoglobin/transferrin/lactoferrin receptor protein
VEDPLTGNQTFLYDEWSNIVGNFKLVYFLNEKFRVFSGVSQGFRAPNLSDLTRLDIARSNEIETPSLELEPENYITYEAGIKSKFSQLKGELAYFFTSIDNMIIRYPSGDTIEGNLEVIKANLGDGYVHGIESRIICNLLKNLSVSVGAAWQSGEVDTYTTPEEIEEREPMSRIPPLTGLLTVKWAAADDKYWIEGVVRGADNQSRLSPRDAGDTQRIPAGGTPGYVIFSLRQGTRINENLSISAAIENITNEDYRIHGSGQNEPGTNLILSFDWNI